MSEASLTRLSLTPRGDNQRTRARGDVIPRVLISCPAIVACAAPGDIPPPASRGAAEFEQMYEAVFRQVVQAIPTPMLAGAEVVCIGLPGDPSPRLLARLRNHRPPLRRLSQCFDEGGKCCRDVQDKPVKARAVRVSGFRGMRGNAAEFTVEIRDGFSDSFRNTFRITRQGAGWVVVPLGLVWSS